MKKFKNIIGDVCIYLISLGSVAVFLGEVINWLMYV